MTPLTPFWSDDHLTLYGGDCREVLCELPDESVHCVVTSPPYWGLRDYGTASWDGGDPECDHLRPVRRYIDGCVGCGVPLQGQTAGCKWCVDRHYRRRKNGTDPDRNFDQPSDDHWDKPRSRDQVATAAVPYSDVCEACGARRIDSQLGLEATPEEFVANMVAVFREVRRVLRKDGTLWLNLGDSYNASPPGNKPGTSKDTSTLNNSRENLERRRAEYGTSREFPGLKPKDLVGIPWRVAFALQADGWYLRSDIIWAKPNPMPESVADRPTKAHEYLFLLTRSPRYYFDAEAVREAPADSVVERAAHGYKNGGTKLAANGDRNDGDKGQRTSFSDYLGGRNLRSVWNIATEPYPGAHFATFPRKLVEPCVKAGTSERGVCPECGAPWVREVEREGIVVPRGNEPHLRRDPGNTLDRDIPTHYKPTITTLGWRASCSHEAEPVPAVVLDPFAGSGTTLLVAQSLGRRGVGIDLSPDYLKQALERNRQTPLGLVG